MRIIPAIDILDGKCVRLHKGDYNSSKSYYDNPLDVAKLFAAKGFQYLHIVDLDGARSKHIVQHKLLERIASQSTLQIDFGGGLKSKEDIRIAFECGAHQINIGSMAIQQASIFEECLQEYGNQKIILSADAKAKKIALQGWTESSEQDLLEFIGFYIQKGISCIACTDIDRDGTLKGPAVELYQEILESYSMNLIASAGVSSIQDVMALKAIGCEGVIIGKAIYEGKINLNELSQLC